MERWLNNERRIQGSEGDPGEGSMGSRPGRPAHPATLMMTKAYPKYQASKQYTCTLHPPDQAVLQHPRGVRRGRVVDVDERALAVGGGWGNLCRVARGCQGVAGESGRLPAGAGRGQPGGRVTATNDPL